VILDIAKQALSCVILDISNCNISDFQYLVKKYMIYWVPNSCDQDYAVRKSYSATADVSITSYWNL